MQYTQVYFRAVLQVVGAETEICPLQLTATQMEWSMNEAYTFMLHQH